MPVYVAPVVSPVPDASQALMGAISSGNVSVTRGGSGKSNLMEAHNQWARRPADERFWTIQEMAQKCREYKDASRDLNVNVRKAEVVNDRGEMLLVGGGLQGPARFSHYSFGQLCRTAGAPADYLRELDGDLAAKCLTTSLRKAIDSRENRSDFCNVLVRSGSNSSMTQRCHAFLSAGYSRIWNSDIVSVWGNSNHVVGESLLHVQRALTIPVHVRRPKLMCSSSIRTVAVLM